MTDATTNDSKQPESTFNTGGIPQSKEDDKPPSYDLATATSIPDATQAKLPAMTNALRTYEKHGFKDHYNRDSGGPHNDRFVPKRQIVHSMLDDVRCWDYANIVSDPMLCSDIYQEVMVTECLNDLKESKDPWTPSGTGRYLPALWFGCRFANNQLAMTYFQPDEQTGAMCDEYDGSAGILANLGWRIDQFFATLNGKSSLIADSIGGSLRTICELAAHYMSGMDRLTSDYQDPFLDDQGGSRNTEVDLLKDTNKEQLLAEYTAQRDALNKKIEELTRDQSVG